MFSMTSYSYSHTDDCNLVVVFVGNIYVMIPCWI